MEFDILAMTIKIWIKKFSGLIKVGKVNLPILFI
jgi:hypothetical protein